MIEPLAKLAWRNIWRNRRRSILTMLAVALAGGVVVFFRAVHVSSWETSVNTSIGLFEGHLQVQANGFRKNGRLEYSFPLTRAAFARIKNLPGVQGVSRRAIGFALMSSRDRSYGASVIGVDPESEPAVSTIPGVVRHGRYLSAVDAREIVIGASLARNLGVGVGEEITMLGQGRDGSVAATVLPIVGIFESGSTELDRLFAEIPLTTFQDVFSMAGEIHSVVISAASVGVVPQLRHVLQGEVTNWPSKRKLIVLSWEELLVGLKQALQLDTTAGWLFYISLILIVSLSIVNTFLMSVVERTREFGVLLALGLTPLRLTTTVIFESILLTAVGLGFGMFFGSAVVMYFGVHGFKVPGSEEIAKQWNMPAVLVPKLSWDVLTTGPGLVLLGGVIAAFIPAVRAAQVDMLRALKQQ